MSIGDHNLLEAIIEIEAEIDALQRRRKLIYEALGKPLDAAPARPASPPLELGTSRKRRSKTTTVAAVDYAAVAEVYKRAVADNQPAIQAIADQFGVSHTTAKNWPGKCREIGLLPPRSEPQVPGGVNDRQVVQSHFASHSGVSVT